MKQGTFTDIEYSGCKKKTRRKEFLEIMDEIIPWDEWVGVIEPYYSKGKRERPPMGIEKMLRMYLLQIWFNLSDSATEDAVYDSYAMRKFTGIDFLNESVPEEAGAIETVTSTGGQIMLPDYGRWRIHHGRNAEHERSANRC